MLQARENLMKAIQAFLKKYVQIPPKEKSMALLLAEEGFLKIKQAKEEEQNQPENIQELLLKLINDLQILNGIQLKQEEQAAKVSLQYWKPPIFYDDDDDYDYEESTIPLNENDSQIPPDLVPIPSESEDTSESDSDCDLPSCDDFSPINVYEEKSVTFSNPLFNSNDDFTFSDEESLFDEDVPEDNVKIYSNPLFEFDDEYISSNVNPLFDEVLENIESKDSYVSNLDESALLVTPLSDFNEDECFNPGVILEGFTDKPPLEENDDLFDLESKMNEWKKIFYNAPINDLMTKDKIFDPGGDIDEIDDFLDIDISMDIEDGYHDSEGDIIYLESLIFDDTIPNLPPKVFLDHDPRSLSDIKDLKIMVKNCPDYEDSRARGFVPRSLDLQSSACLYIGIRYPRSY
ncbi:hypothetical protein Tco_0172960 [Tanacetum coccineum]